MATSAYTLTGSEFPPLPRTLPSGAFSISARRFIISSVIGGLSVRLGSALQPYRTSSMTAAKPLARQRAVGALASGSATVELHHHPGHDPRPRQAPLSARLSARPFAPRTCLTKQHWI